MVCLNKKSLHESKLSLKNYFPTISITVPNTKIAAKKTKETTKPTPESIASFRFDCTFFSNSFTSIPPVSTYSIDED